MIRRALRLESLTLGWILVEAVVAIWSGMAAHSLSLTAFGLDSVIELASAGVLLWRLERERRHGRGASDSAELAARRIAGGLLLILALYVVAAAALSLWRGAGQAFSAPGLTVTLLAIPIMLWLARQKRALAQALGSRALRADAAEAVGCLWLSAAVIVGQVVQLALGAWWILSQPTTPAIRSSFMQFCSETI
ncbi:MAG TPA: cation transporter [Stellaceae bacterium]|nr:cation transporter [Stellaceae bacterium]